MNDEEYIALNPESSNIRDNTSRFSGAIWYEAIHEKTVTLAGLGGIGSYVGFLLARMNPAAMYIYDDDVVETANMSGQLYSNSDVGERKASALARKMSQYSLYGSVYAYNTRFTEESNASDIMICGFDSMSSRSTFFEKWLERVNEKDEEGKKHCLFIDGRLAAEELQVYCFTGDNQWAINEYRNALFSDDQADPTVCSYKQTSYMANMIGSIIVNLFTNFVANEMLGFLGRELPFLTTYDGITMQLKLK